MERFPPLQVQDYEGSVYDINPESLIGVGQYSHVYAINLGGRQFALKLVPVYKISGKPLDVFNRGIEFIQNQIRQGQVNRNQHIVTYYSEFIDQLDLKNPIHCIVMELGAGTLFELGRKFCKP